MTHTVTPIGRRVSGRCVTNYTEHVGQLVVVEVASTYSNGVPREYRYTIRDESTGREVILWPGTERVEA